MEKILHVASTFKSHEVEDGSVMIRGMASTDHSDRAGDVIAAEAWSKGGLENFKNNPVILFNHDYDKPIGRATGVNVTKNGLELEAKISKSAPAAVCELVKDGVLGAFSVGFKVKDADYIKETDGLMIKDAELFEVSVVSVPCNQAATFSLAKSFDSVDEYEAFKKTFTNRVDLTGQSLTKDDSKESNLVSDAPKHVEKSTNKETKMSEDNTPAIDLEAFAKKVADETAAKIAMKQAEQKAAEEAEAKAAAEAVAQKAAEQEAVEKTIRTGIETGAEKLMADVQADMAKAKEGEVAEVVAKYEAQLKEKADELEQMRKSKRDFSDSRSKKGNVSAWGREFLQAKVLGAITGKGYDTDFGKELMEKAGVDFGTALGSTNPNLDSAVITQFAEDTKAETKVAQLFNEIPVNAGVSAMPFAPQASVATFSGEGISKVDAPDQNQLSDAGNSNYTVATKVLNAHRLIAGTFIDNNTDEQIVVNLLPMLTSQLAVAHARALDSAILLGAGSSSISAGLVGHDGTDGAAGFLAADSGLASKDASTTTDVVSAGDLLTIRREMGRYGVDPTRVAFVLPYDQYYELMDDAGFADITEVGSDAALGRGINPRVTGVLGFIYGSPVVASEFLANQIDSGASDAPTTTAAVAVNLDQFVIPRLRGVNIETDYQVAYQRTALVASQSLGFEQLAANSTDNNVAVRITYS
jgi:HK97 family phage prohead protease